LTGVSWTWPICLGLASEHLYDPTRSTTVVDIVSRTVGIPEYVNHRTNGRCEKKQQRRCIPHNVYPLVASIQNN
jgi:hypothetical protein